MRLNIHNILFECNSTWKLAAVKKKTNNKETEGENESAMRGQSKISIECVCVWLCVSEAKLKQTLRMNKMPFQLLLIYCLECQGNNKNFTEPATRFSLFCFFAFYKIKINIICPVFILHLSVMFEVNETVVLVCKCE